MSSLERLAFIFVMLIIAFSLCGGCQSGTGYSFSDALFAEPLSGFDIQNASTDSVVPVLEHYRRCGGIDKKIKSWYYLGAIHASVFLNYAEAVNCYLRAREYAVKKNRVHDIAVIDKALGEVFGGFSSFSNSSVYLQEAYDLGIAAQDTVLALSSLYLLANHSLQPERAEWRDSVYRQLIDHGLPEPTYSRLLASYAFFLLEREDYEDAIVYFDSALAGFGNQYIQAPNIQCAYAYALACAGRYNASDSLFSVLDNFGYSNTQPYQRWKARTCYLQHDFKEAYQLLFKSYDRKTETLSSLASDSAVQGQNIYLLDKYKDTTRERNFVLIFFVWVVILLSTIGILLIKQNRQIKEKNEMLLSSVSTLTSQLESRTEELQNTHIERQNLQTAYVQIFREHFSKMGTMKDILSYCHTSQGVRILLKEIRKMVEDLRYDSDGQFAFEVRLNEACDNVMMHYRESFPDKRPADYQCVLYLFAGFDTATLCSIMGGKSKDSIYSRKRRIVKEIRESETPYKDQFLSFLA